MSPFKTQLIDILDTDCFIIALICNPYLAAGGVNVFYTGVFDQQLDYHSN